MKKNNTVEKSIIKADKISKALKENTEKTLRDLVNETINNLILEEEETPEVEDDENDYEVEDVNVEKDSEETDAPEVDEPETEEAPEEGEEDEWSEYEEFKTDDNDYDITDQDEEGIEILRKMYDMLEDGDELIVTKNGDNEMMISNEETGEEEVIDMSDEENEFEIDVDDEDSDEEVEFEIDVEDFDEDEPEFEFDNEDSDEDDEEEFEVEIDDEDELTESFGYTTEYQKVPAMTTPKNTKEPLEGTHEGDVVPTEDGKRYGKSKGDFKPYDCKSTCCKNEDVISEETIDETARTYGDFRKKKKSMAGINGDRVPEGSPTISDENGYHATYSKVKESYEKMKKENEILKESVKAAKKSLMEAAVLNVNLGKIVNLLVNETTTRDEKKSILSRFNEVKTINEGNTLYNTIKRELNESKKNTITLDKSIVAESKNNLNETTFYQDRAKNPSLALMDRLDNLWKK